jgi:hypothetical protein
VISRLVLLVSVAAIAGAVVATLLIAVSRKIGRAVGDRRRARLERDVRPLLVRALAGEVPDDLRLRGARAATLADLAVGAVGTVRGESHRALGQLLDRLGTLDAARRRIRRPGLVRRARAAEILGAVGDRSDLPAIARLVRHRVPEVRQVAARALGSLGEPDAVPLLLRALQGRKALPAGQVSMAIWRIGPPAIEGLRGALGAADPTTRLVAAELLGELVALRATPDLVAVLTEDDDVEVRRRAAVALGRLGTPQAVVPLLACLPDDQPQPVRVAAVASLARVGAVEAVPPLLSLLDQSHELAQAAAVALVRTGPRGREALAEVVDAGAPGADHARAALAVARLEDTARRAGARRARTRPTATASRG